MAPDSPYKVYLIKAIHISERLKLKELRERLSSPPIEFSNYEMVVRYAEDSYLFLYNFGAAVFFNVPDDIQALELGRIQEASAAQSPPPSTDFNRASDLFLLEVQPETQSNRVFFDRLVVRERSYSVLKIVCMLLAESTALDYYEQLVEKLLLQANVYSKRLRAEGRLLRNSQDLIKFIGLCLDTKQEIISNLYIVDSPDETWESVELDKIHQELKVMMEIDTRYRALEYKIKIIEESLNVMIDLSKSKRETFLELTIIALIAFEIILTLWEKWGG